MYNARTVLGQLLSLPSPTGIIFYETTYQHEILGASSFVDLQLNLDGADQVIADQSYITVCESEVVYMQKSQESE